MTGEGQQRVGAGRLPGGRPAAPLVFWGSLLATLGGVQAAFGGHLLPVLVQVGGGVAIVLIGVGVLVVNRLAAPRSPGQGARPIALPTVSVATALAGTSLCAMLAGAAVGTWLVIGGALGLGLAAGGLVRELRAQHADLAERVSEGQPGPSMMPAAGTASAGETTR